MKTDLAEMSRREFVLSAAATAAAGVSSADDERPLLRIGAMTDNHLHAERPATHRRTKACFDLFRRANVDIVVDTGDIADLSDTGELRYFRKCFDDAFADTDCVPFFCIANHDYNYVPNTRRNDPKNIENAWRALGMNGPNPTAVVKGYRFVNVFQNEPDHTAFAKAVAKAVAENEGNRPVFVVNHEPPFMTTTGTVHWSSRGVREVLNRYPQVVALTGHIHTAVTWAGNIWQGEFTAVNLGAHAEYSNRIDGEAVVLDVFADRIDIRRYEAVSGREIGADDRWSIPLPIDPAHGPYRTERRTKTCPVPILPDDASVHYEQNATGTQGLISFSTAKPGNSAYHYRMTVESQADDGSWKFLSTLNWATPQAFSEPGRWTFTITPAIFDGGRRHRATVTPVSSLEVVGPSRTMMFDVPKNPAKALPESLTRATRYQRAPDKGECVFTPDADGWFEKTGGQVIVVLSEEFTEAIADKKTAMLVIDLASEQPDTPNTLSIGKFPAAARRVDYGIGDRIYTLPGNMPTHRYAWTLRTKKLSPGDTCCLVIREGGAHRFKLNGITCYVDDTGS